MNPRIAVILNGVLAALFGSLAVTLPNDTQIPPDVLKWLVPIVLAVNAALHAVPPPTLNGIKRVLTLFMLGGSLSVFLSACSTLGLQSPIAPGTPPAASTSIGADLGCWINQAAGAASATFAQIGDNTSAASLAAHALLLTTAHLCPSATLALPVVPVKPN